MKALNRRTLVLGLFVLSLYLTSCAPKAEGQIIQEGPITYSGDVTEIYKDGTSYGCSVPEQTVMLKGPYKYEGTTFTEVSRQMENPGDCDRRAFKWLIDPMSLRMSQPIFSRQNK